MKKVVIPIIVVCFVLAIAGSILAAALLQEPDYVHMTDLKYSAKVVDELNSKGKVEITEELTFEIHAASQYDTFWELWRDLPEEYVDGVKVYYEISSVKRLTVNGQAAPLTFNPAKRLYVRDSDYISTIDGLGPNRWYHSEGPYDPDYDNYECLLLYVDGLYRETDVFEIKYTMYNAAMRYADCSELYLSLYSGDSVKHLKSVKGEILIPDAKMPAEGNYDAHTYGTINHNFAFEKSATKNAGFFTFSFELNESQLKFKPYNQYIEFSLISHGADKWVFTQNASVNAQYNTPKYEEFKKGQAEYNALPTQFLIIKIIVLLILIAAAVFIAFIPVLIDKHIRKKYKFFNPAVDFKIFREIPSELDTNLAANLVFCKHKLSDDVPGAYSALMLSLVRKKYIDIDRINPTGKWVESNVNIKIKNTLEEIRKPLTSCEEAFFNLIRRHSVDGVIRMNHFQIKIQRDYEHTNEFVRDMKRVGKSSGFMSGYYQTLNFKQPKINGLARVPVFFVIGLIVMLAANLISVFTRMDLAFGGYFILGAGFIAAAVLSAVYARKYVLLTQLGEDEYAKWRGLYNFMKDETLMKEQTVDRIEMWEEYLVYATAFGIPEKILKVIETKFPQYAQSQSRIIRHPFLCAGIFVVATNRGFRTSTRGAVSSYRSSMRGGGYGGGGRGGGGAGGGH